MDVSVIMINYNTFELTKNALESVFTNTRDISYEVILIDNLSPDGSGEELTKLYRDKIVYIQSGANLGTSKAFNIALKKTNGKYVLWLNTDILLKGNFIKELYDFMERTPDCGICGGNVLDFNNKPIHSFRRQLPSLKTDKKDMSVCMKVFRMILKKQLSTEYNYTGKPMEVGYITGADMMIRREVFDKIGEFDEDIFMYAEESEFTFRMKKMTSYKVFSVPNAYINHLEGASSSKDHSFSEKKYRMTSTGLTIYMKKCYGDEKTIKFLKYRRRVYLKFMFLCIFILRINKFKQYRKKRLIMKEFLNNYPDFMKRKT